MGSSKLSVTIPDEIYKEIKEFTSNKKLAGVPGNVILIKGTANLPITSVAVVSQVATVDKNRLLEKIGTLDKEKTEEVIKGCQMVIGLTVF